MEKYWFFVIIIFSLFSCKNEESNKSNSPIQIAEASIDDALADSIKTFFTSTYFLKDSAYLTVDSTAFQLYKIDLNEDNENEIFVRFMDPYFCGSGGCTFLILNQKFEELNRFTAMKAPIIASNESKNGWRVLLTQSEGKLREIVSKNDRYPSNPSMVPISTITLSADDISMFDDALNPSKTYYF